MAQRIKVHSEEESQLELDTTTVSPTTARVLTVAFLLSISVLPVVQFANAFLRAEPVRELELVAPVGRAAAALADQGGRAAWNELQPVFDRRWLRAFEEGLAAHSHGKAWVQPRVQELLTGLGGFGNSKGVVGRDGWLFYQPGLDHVMGPGILDAEYLRVRRNRMIDREGIDNPQLDPGRAIRDLQRQCQAAGVTLIVVPVPDKAQLQPGQLTSRLSVSQPRNVPTNRDWTTFISGLRADGVTVVDLAPSELRPDDAPRYLVQDTHWTPEFMTACSATVAAAIGAQTALPPAAVASSLHEQPISRLGDIVGMLKMTDAQAIYRPQSVATQQVRRSDGSPWTPTRGAPVLLLGDSFTNIYSDGVGAEGLGWGVASGFAAHLSHRLGQPVDVIARNGSAATAVRKELARRPAPLAGVKVLVWEFAVRELTSAQWDLVDLSPKSTTPAATTAAQIPTTASNDNGAELPWVRLDADLQGVGDALDVEAVLRSPIPDEARKSGVYTSNLVFLAFEVRRVVAGQHSGAPLHAQVVGLRNKQPQPGLDLQVGQTYRLRLRAEAAPVASTWSPIELQDDFASSHGPLQAWWIEAWAKLP